MELIIRSNHMQEVEGITAEYPYVLNRVSGADTRVPWHWHEEVEFSLVVKGRLRVSVSGYSRVIEAGEGFYINSNILHTMEPVDPDEEVLWNSYMFHSVFLGGHYKSVFDTKYMSPVLQNRKYELASFRGESEDQCRILQLLQEAAQQQDLADSEFRIRNIFSEIWLLLIRVLAQLEQSEQLVKPVSQERIQIMLSYIHQHYPEKIALEEIAASAIVSKRECLRCFQTCIQKTPFEYLLDYRIRMAEKLLRTTALPVTQIAIQTGFSNSAYFTKVFRQLRGVAPGQYRRAI